MHALPPLEPVTRPGPGLGHPALAARVVEALAQHGIRAEAVGNEAACIVRLKDGVSGYGFVCSDLPSRGRDDRWTVLEWMLTRSPGLPAALVSGTGGAVFLCERVQGGVVAAFRRPFRSWQVQQTLAEVLPYL